MAEQAWVGTNWIDRGRAHLAALLDEGNAGNRQARRQAARLHRALEAAGVSDLPSLPPSWKGRPRPSETDNRQN